MPLSLLATKLFKPQTRTRLVARLRLFALLDQGLARKLIVVAAPAGFGKSTLVAEWLRQAAPASAWLSLDESDNDPTRFFAYLLAALQQIDPAIGRTAQPLLERVEVSALPLLVTILINDLSQQTVPNLLVLDDYHVITERAIHEAVTFFLDRLPPSLHVILISRSDPPLPLARWRVQRDLLEVRARDLRFTQSEIVALLQHELDLQLTPADLAALEQRTEGWVAGLQLLMLSLADHPEATRFIQNFSGVHTYIVDYLVEEVLQRQPVELVQFLMQGSLLERLSGPFCDAALERRDSQQLLEQIERRNLFLMPLDDQRRWYRFHHLFAQVLRRFQQQSQPAQSQAIHLQASHWCEQHGFQPDAIYHALAADCVERAADLIGASAESLLNRGESATLLHWLRSLPQQVLATRPRLLLAQARIHLLSHQLDETARCLQAAEAAVQANAAYEADPFLQGELLAVRSHVLINQGDVTGTIQLTQAALANLPDQHWRQRGEVSLLLGVAYQWSGRHAEAVQAYQTSSSLNTQAGNLPMAIQAIVYRSRIHQAQGELRQAIAVLQEAHQLAVEHQVQQLPIMAIFHVTLGQFYYEQNDLAGAAHQVAQGIRQAELAQNPRTWLRGYGKLLPILAAQGNSSELLDTMRRAEQLIQQHQFPPAITDDYYVNHCKQWLQRGAVTSAASWLERRGVAHTPLSIASETNLFALHVRVLAAQGELTAAWRQLTPWLRLTEQTDNIPFLLENTLVAAQLQAALGEPTRALDYVQRAIELAEPQGLIRSLIDEGEPLRQLLEKFKAQLATRYADDRQLAQRLHLYLDKVLAAFAVSAQFDAPQVRHPATQAIDPPARGLIEPLTERECEVLSLVAQGLSDRQVADQLIVAVGTVKRHLNNLYGKLGVHSRTAALAKAKSLGLLTEAASPRS